MINVIDISEHNVRRGAIDWNKVKASGVDGVIIRIGWAGYEGELHLDPNLDDCIRKAFAAKLKVGLYVYTYTTSPNAAKKAAFECLNIARQYPNMITLPIAFDVEETTLPCLAQQGREGLTDTTTAFMDAIISGGYSTVWYTYTAFAIQYLNRQRLLKYPLWIADYRGDQALMESQLGRSDYVMWQYIGDRGTCPGVNGACDRNYCYIDFDQKDYKSLYFAAQSKLDRIMAILKEE